MSAEVMMHIQSEIDRIENSEFTDVSVENINSLIEKLGGSKTISGFDPGVSVLYYLLLLSINNEDLKVGN